ncbi:hypothetical protein Q7P35_001856 [Cladosporium inversicolor]
MRRFGVVVDWQRLILMGDLNFEEVAVDYICRHLGVTDVDAVDVGVSKSGVINVGVVDVGDGDVGDVDVGALLDSSYDFKIATTSSEPKSLTKIKGSTYKVLHQLTTQILHEEGRGNNSDIAERDKADDAGDETSKENFYDARSQFEDLQDTATAEEHSIVEDLAADREDPRAEDLAAAAHDSPAEHGFFDARSQFENVQDTSTTEEDIITEDLAAAGGDSPVEDERILPSNGTGNNASVTTSPTEDNITRLDRSKRVIFHEDDSSAMEPFTASSRSPVNATSPSLKDPDVEMFDDLASNNEQSENSDIAPRQKKPMQTFGTISKYLSSNKSAAQHGINSDSADPEDEAASLVRNPKPLTLRRTSVAPTDSAPQPNTSDEPIGSHERDNMALTIKDSFNSDADETEPAPTSMKPKDPAAQKAARAKWAAAGGLAKSKLRARVAENDKNIRGGSVPRLWKGKEEFGTNPDLKAVNIRLEDIIKKQVKIHNLLAACTDADAASDLRQRLEPWAKNKVDKYESQLDAIFSAVLAICLCCNPVSLADVLWPSVPFES